MKSVTAIAAAVLAAALPFAAQAQNGWQPVDQRQQNLDRRIDIGVRNGSLTRSEARGLRAEFMQIARLEQRYRQGGLSRWERGDLDRRFDKLAASIRTERNDWQERRPSYNRQHR